MLSIYCDGSSSGRSNKPGGWAFVIVRDGEPILANYGGEKLATNNSMELRAAIEGLKAVKENGWHINNVVELVSDSEYTLKIANGTYQPQKNLELCKELVELYIDICDRVRWVKGHSGDTWNSRCDSLSKQGKREITEKL